ncbi:MAG: hypothetical protein JST80_13670 [Bdellovibrionales bacterium]|nr:hypothetical protein [Bdellovibrionales bacterium]
MVSKKHNGFKGLADKSLMGSPVTTTVKKPLSKITWIAIFVAMAGAGAFAFPLLKKSNTATTADRTMEKTFQPKPAKLSGVITLKDSCQAGYYQVRLQGTEASQIQVDSQTDQSGHFNLVAPPGQYVMTVNKGECGSVEKITLEENTEHMLAVNIQETKPVEKTCKIRGRLPASVLVLPKR